MHTTLRVRVHSYARRACVGHPCARSSALHRPDRICQMQIGDRSAVRCASRMYCPHALCVWGREQPRRFVANRESCFEMSVLPGRPSWTTSTTERATSLLSSHLPSARAFCTSGGWPTISTWPTIARPRVSRRTGIRGARTGQRLPGADCKSRSGVNYAWGERARRVTVTNMYMLECGRELRPVAG